MYEFFNFLTFVMICSAKMVTIKQTTYGDVIGTIYDNQAEIFLGIPYAKAPIGKLRFEYPERPDPWRNNGPLKATKYKNCCIQFTQTSGGREGFTNEDCLYLNIFVPKNTTLDQPKYPVLMWIHGGSYQVGCSNHFPISTIVKHLVTRGLIVVTINYRLGPLGFASLLNKHLPGNYGTEDQILALKWIQENIHFFGGDGTNVTVAGESAGASSVSLLGVSPKASGLMSKLIIRSGSVLTTFGVRSNSTMLNTKTLIESVGCDSELKNDHQNLMACLQEKDSSKFEKAWVDIWSDDLKAIFSKGSHQPKSGNNPYFRMTYFTPVIDDYRLSETVMPLPPIEMIEKFAYLPLMIGCTSGEDLSYIAYLSHNNVPLSIETGDLDLIAPPALFKNYKQVHEAIFAHYHNPKMQKDEQSQFKLLEQISSDRGAVVPIMQEAETYRRKNLSVFVYIFDYVSNTVDIVRPTEVNLAGGAMHGMDMLYMFQSFSVVDPEYSFSFTWTEKDINITDLLSETIFNFASSGNPSSSAVQWPLYTADHRYILKIGEEAKLIEYSLNGTYRFWTEFIPFLEKMTFRESDLYKAAFYITLSLLIALCIIIVAQILSRSPLLNGRYRFHRVLEV